MAEPITVGIDGTPLAGPIGGIRRFTDQLIQALRQEFPDDNYVPLSDQFAPTPKGIEKRWWLYGLNRALYRTGGQVFHGTDFAVPYLSRRPSVMTIHDLSPWRSPTPANARVRSRTGMLLRLGIPTWIHTPTETIRREVIDRFRWPADRIVAIPHAAAGHFEPMPVTGEPYFLYLGTLEPRKNLGVIVAAIDQLWRQGTRVPLYLAGQVREGCAVPQHEAVRYLGPQEEGELPKLLSSAKAVLYPSVYEGFGLPILEAMQCAAPVIASDIEVHREVGGRAARYAGVDEAGQWAQQMQLALDQPPRREELVAHARSYSWAATARAFRRLYLRCLGGPL